MASGEACDATHRCDAGFTCVSAPAVLDAPNMARWIKKFKQGARYPIRIWSIHNHIDANRHRTSGTRELLRITRGKLWFSETGGIVNRWVDGRRVRRYNQKNAVRAIRNVFKLAKLNRRRITRIYLYHWQAPPQRRPRGVLALERDAFGVRDVTHSAPAGRARRRACPP